MKRAEVYRGGEAWWMVVVWSGEIPERELPIRMRASSGSAHRLLCGEDFDTYAEALAYALASVGLTPTNPKEQA